MKNILDGHGQQLKSPKSKKFRGLNRDTLACTKLFPSVLVTFANLFNYLEVRVNVTERNSAVYNLIVFQSKFV